MTYPSLLNLRPLICFGPFFTIVSSIRNFYIVILLVIINIIFESIYCIVLYNSEVLCFIRRDMFLAKTINVGYSRIHFLKTGTVLLFLRNITAKWCIIFTHVIIITSIMTVGVFRWMWFTTYFTSPPTSFHSFLLRYFWH